MVSSRTKIAYAAVFSIALAAFALCLISLLDTSPRNHEARIPRRGGPGNKAHDIADAEEQFLLPHRLHFPAGSYPQRVRQTETSPLERCGFNWDIGPRGPVIIGGIGDSGTRGTRALVDQLTGYSTCPQPGLPV